MTAKVLICVPTSSRHSYCLDEFLDRIRSLTIPANLLIYDNTLDTDEYYKLLKSKTDSSMATIKRHIWNPEKQNAVQMLADVKAKMRKHFLLNNYTHYFDIASDFMLEPDTLEKLLKHDKDCVGCVTHMFHSGFEMPAVWKWRGSNEKSGFISADTGMDIYNWDEVKDTHGLQRVYACAVALYKRRVMGCCQFRTHPTLIYGEDLWWFCETNDKGFEWWCDFDQHIVHKNTDWTGVPAFKRTNLYFAIGPADAKEAVFIVRNGPCIPAT